MSNRLVSALMTLLGLRLGYWIRSLDKWHVFINMYFPGLKGLFGFGFKKNASYLELSDGGHFDNTGVYELLRRRVHHIILCDAGCDPDFKFNDLANLIERARVDFGVEIDFNSDTGLVGLLPGSASLQSHPAQVHAAKHHLSERGHAVAMIKYPRHPEDTEDRTGTLTVIKTTLVPELPADVYGYRNDNPKFPDQTTGDQFFNERQFEAYRELGYQLGKMALNDPKVAMNW